MSNNRELDSITPNFTLTDEQIADLKRMLVDDEYAKEVAKEHELYKEKYLNELKNMLKTGLSSKGTVLSELRLRRIKEEYESISGRTFDEHDEL